MRHTIQEPQELIFPGDLPLRRDREVKTKTLLRYPNMQKALCSYSCPFLSLIILLSSLKT